MHYALLLNSNPKADDFYRELLENDGYDEIVRQDNGSSARRMINNRDYDICIINAPLKDEFGRDLAIDLATSSNAQIIITVKAEIYDEVSSELEDYGIITVSRPINKSVMWSAIKFADVTRARMNKVWDENEKLQQKIEDIRIISRAKLLLITYLNMTEEEAHRYIEKQAMDTRLSKKAVALNILKTYES